VATLSEKSKDYKKGPGSSVSRKAELWSSFLWRRGFESGIGRYMWYSLTIFSPLLLILIAHSEENLKWGSVENKSIMMVGSRL